MGESLRMEFECEKVNDVTNEGLYKIWLEYKRLSARKSVESMQHTSHSKNYYDSELVSVQNEIGMDIDL